MLLVICPFWWQDIEREQQAASGRSVPMLGCVVRDVMVDRGYSRMYRFSFVRYGTSRSIGPPLYEQKSVWVWWVDLTQPK